MKTKTGVILAAGIGHRLDIFETHKPLVKLQGVSLLRWTIERFFSSGIEDIHIVVRPEDRLIRKELVELYDRVHLINHIYPEQGMLGAILSITQAGLNEPFFVTPCDLIFDGNPLALFPEASDAGAVSVLVSTDKNHNATSGAQEKCFFSDGTLEYAEKSDNFNALEVGIYHFTAASYDAFCQIASSTPDSNIVSKVFGAHERVVPVEMSGMAWFDINTPVTLVRADIFLQKQKLPDPPPRPIEAEFEPMPVTATFDYNKPIHFDVHVGQGALDQVNKYEIIPHEFFYSPHHILVDKNIDALYGQKVFEQFSALGYRVHKHLIDPGETSKSAEYYAATAEKILAIGIEKKSIILSIGGGVVKDLAGFLASTLYRGIGFISFPTTVLSQCDAAIALKQGVNGTRGKNLLGSYYAPMKVIVDPAVLKTLETRYIYDGLAECLKQAFAQDVDFYRFFDGYKGEIDEVNFLEEAVRRAIQLKVASITQDFFEENVSLVNQYGHEVGHAVEHLSGYELLHGESVAIGMRVSAELARVMGVAGQDVVDAHVELLKKYRLPCHVPRHIHSEDIVHTLRYNKKFHGGKARMVLVDQIGSLWHDGSYFTVFCDDRHLKEAIDKSYER